MFSTFLKQKYGISQKLEPIIIIIIIIIGIFIFLSRESDEALYELA